MTSPQGAATYGQATRGGCLRCTCIGGGRQQPARKGLPPAASPAASRGGGVSRRGGRPLAGRLSAVKDSHRLRRGSDNGGAVRVKEG
ncbi:hypothetical protein B296_00032470 [Ensete ventricosum]|uniref:Uncharacterized protein n=1 Tax=Ensete ventricosum TaxID=4639 RepID=A0A426X1Y3_ENSVE|nr:hypothetical protein B296_00032470 [Ensete ventricosum]